MRYLSKWVVRPTFILGPVVEKKTTLAEVEKILAAELPEVEVVDVEVAGGGRSRILQVFIDHPEGVDHELCARVMALLDRYLEDYTVEVSSPGLERRLRKPEHFRAAVGKQINVRTFGPVEGQRNFTGFLISADDEQLRLKLDDREAVISVADIARARTVYEFDRPDSMKRGRFNRGKH